MNPSLMLKSVQYVTLGDPCCSIFPYINLCAEGESEVWETGDWSLVMQFMSGRGVIFMEAILTPQSLCFCLGNLMTRERNAPRPGAPPSGWVGWGSRDLLGP